MNPDHGSTTERTGGHTADPSTNRRHAEARSGWAETRRILRPRLRSCVGLRPRAETVKVKIDDRYGLFLNGRFVTPQGAQTFATINPATEQAFSQITQSAERDVDAAVDAARALLPVGRAQARQARPSTSSASRGPHPGARELAILETMDGGKPIRESRDVDVPLAARAFYYAGWAIGSRTPSRQVAALPRRRLRPDHPLELPPAHGRVGSPPPSPAATMISPRPPEPTRGFRLAEILGKSNSPPAS